MGTLHTWMRSHDPREGESIAVNGVCLTARHIEARRFSADVSPETLDRSCLGGLRVGDRVNLERALRPLDRLGGHLVSGHIDGMGRVQKRRALGNFTLFTFAYFLHSPPPREEHQFISLFMSFSKYTQSSS